ncbi:protease YdgD [Hyphomicrobium sp. 1Nfss2.1]
MAECSDIKAALHATKSRSRILVGLCAAGVLAASAFSNELRANIFGTDDRVIVEERGTPWDAIGQVNIGGYRSLGQCTGTLVAPDIVITAAHCVIDSWKAAPYPLHDIHFLAGLRRESYLGHATAKCLHFLPGYQLPEKALSARAASEFASLHQEGTDVVAIVLTDRLDVATVPLAKSSDVAPGTWLTYAGYPADRRYMLSAHMGCRLLGVEQDPLLWLHDCDTQPASSGGPLLTKANGEFQLAAVNIGSGSEANVAVPVAGHAELARDDSCPQ